MRMARRQNRESRMNRKAANLLLHRIQAKKRPSSANKSLAIGYFSNVTTKSIGTQNLIVFHRKPVIGWFPILIAGIIVSAISFSYFQNIHTVVIFSVLFFVGAASDFIKSKSHFVELDKQSLTIFWGVLDASHPIKIELGNIERVKLINIDSKKNLGPTMSFTKRESQQEVLKIKLKASPSNEAASSNLLHDSLFDSDSFWIDKENREIWIRTPPKEGFPSLLSSINTHISLLN